MKIVMIIGLPGSGKTTYAKSLGGLLVDDASLNRDQLFGALERNDVPLLVITDPMACSSSRDAINEIIGDHDLKIVCFENDPKACWTNLERRGDNKISQPWVERMSAQYRVEDFSPDLLLKVYRPLSSGA